MRREIKLVLSEKELERMIYIELCYKHGRSIDTQNSLDIFPQNEVDTIRARYEKNKSNE
jgi:hypothetical protein